MYINPSCTTLFYNIFTDSHVFTFLKCFYFLVVCSLTLLALTVKSASTGIPLTVLYLQRYPIKMLFFPENPGIPNIKLT